MDNSNFIDYIKIFCKSGNGGAGSTHFMRTKYNPMAGPDGGNGGRGGHIILRGNKNLWTLLHLRYKKHIHSGNGNNGFKNNSTGHDGKDEIIEVPLGTIVRDLETNALEAEILEHNQEIIFVKGGRGGMGNAFFRTPTKQTPRFSQPGESGIEAWKVFELKLLADIGLVGFPNAGKSTLLSKISAAKPKIANYPFTTLVPQLGIVDYKNEHQFCVADLPGIIEGAHEGKGLGFRFLRHIERNAILAIVISVEEADIKKKYKLILDELKQFDNKLLTKNLILVVTKTDLVTDKELVSLQKKFKEKIKTCFISAHTGIGLDEMKNLFWQTLTPFL